EAGQEVDRDPETHRADEVWRAGFELVGGVVVDGLLEADRQDHVAAPLVGGHLFEQLAPAVENADAGRPVHLVPGQRVEVTAERLHVNGEVGGSLRAVNEDAGPRSVGDLRDGPDRVYRPEHVGDVGDGDELG